MVVAPHSDWPPLRLIYSGFTDAAIHRVIDAVLDTFKPDYCEYYYDTPHESESPIPGVGHFYIDVQKGDYKVDWNTIAPLDEGLLDALGHCEATVMRMLDRNDIWAPLSYAERKSLYLKHVRYWANCIERNRINLVLFSGIPHSTFDYILYALCKYKRIPTLVFSCSSLLIDTVFLSDDIDDPAPELGARFRHLCDAIKPEERSQIVLPDWLEKQFRKMSDVQTDQTPFYMKDPMWDRLFDRDWEGGLSKLARLAKSPWTLIRKAADTGKWVTKLQSRSRLRVQDRQFREIVDFYNENAEPVDLTSRFIYVPLHLQPECTTSPMGGAFVEQQLMVQLLATAAPADVMIYVKEHPMQDKYGLVGRSVAFYRELLEIRNVRLIPRSTSTYTLMENCAALATVTGAAGWEGLFRRKPYLMFGHHVYQYAPGVMPVRDLASCRAAMDAIFREGAAPELGDLRLFLKAVEETAIHGFSVAGRRDVSEVGDDENVANLTPALLSKIESLGFQRKKD